MREQDTTQVTAWDSVPLPVPAPQQQVAQPQTTPTQLQAEVRPPYTDGLQPIARQQMLGNHAGVMTLMLGTLLLISLNFKYCRAAFATLFEDCWNVRRRASLFDDHGYGESRTAMVLFILTAVCEGVLLASRTNGSATPMAVMALTAGAAVYLALQIAAYWTLGYTFSDPEGRRLYMRGFVATQSLLGPGLAIPALLVLFVPAGGTFFFSLGVIMYMTARLTFIVKGFRLFYDGFYSLSYFILYLCTLEVAPLWVLWRLADNLA